MFARIAFIVFVCLGALILIACSSEKKEGRYESNFSDCSDEALGFKEGWEFNDLFTVEAIEDGVFTFRNGRTNEEFEGIPSATEFPRPTAEDKTLRVSVTGHENPDESVDTTTIYDLRVGFVGKMKATHCSPSLGKELVVVNVDFIDTTPTIEPAFY